MLHEQLAGACVPSACLRARSADVRLPAALTMGAFEPLPCLPPAPAGSLPRSRMGTRSATAAGATLVPQPCGRSAARGSSAGGAACRRGLRRPPRPRAAATAAPRWGCSRCASCRARRSRRRRSRAGGWTCPAPASCRCSWTRRRAGRGRGRRARPGRRCRPLPSWRRSRPRRGGGRGRRTKSCCCAARASTTRPPGSGRTTSSCGCSLPASRCALVRPVWHQLNRTARRWRRPAAARSVGWWQPIAGGGRCRPVPPRSRARCAAGRGAAAGRA